MAPAWPPRRVVGREGARREPLPPERVPPFERVLPEAPFDAVPEERVLADSYHVATLDHDAPAIFAGSVDFVRTHAPAAAG